MNTTTEQFTCKRCVMDRTAEEIEFTDTGCTFCDLALRVKPEAEPPPNLKTQNKYDVLLGLSGGADSSYCLHLLVKMGIRPLCYTIDNGYNNPQADENILKMVEALEVPFYRYTIDLDKFKELQVAFMQSGTKNLEIPTDHILMASAYEMADLYGIKTIVSGGNWATESIMPRSWGYQPRDAKHIKAIYKMFAGKKLKGLPVCGLLRWNWYKWIKGIKTVNLLDYFDYNRAKAVKILNEKYNWQDYHEKHCENYFTWWFQNYYLFQKWGIDKRKAHYSSLILSGQMTREEAMERLLENPIFPTLGLEKKVMEYPKRDYTEYPNDEKLFEFISKCVRYARSFRFFN